MRFFEKLSGLFLVLTFFIFAFSLPVTAAEEPWQTEMLEGRKDMDAKDYDKAIKHYKKAMDLNQDPEFQADTLGAIGVTYMAAGDYKKAAKYLDKAIKANEELERPSSLQSQIIALRAIVALAMGDISKFTEYTSRAKQLGQQASDAPGAPADGKVWAPGDNAGEIIHQRTGVKFPRTLGEFTRANNLTIDNDGSDVSILYMRGANGAEGVFSIYLTAGQGDDLGAVINVTKQAVAMRYGGSMKLLDEEFLATFDNAGNKVGTGYRGLFEVPRQDGVEGIQHTEVWLVRSGDWNIKFRVSYYPEQAADIEKQIGNAVSTLNLLNLQQFQTLYALWAIDVPVCNVEAADLAGDGTSYPADLKLSVGLTLEASGKLLPSEFPEPEKCLVEIVPGSSGHKLAVFIPEHVDRDAVFKEAPIFDLALYDPEWAVIRRYAVYRSAMLEEAMAQDENPLEGPFYFLSQNEEDQIIIYDLFQGKPSLATAIEGVSKILSGASPGIVSANQDDEGNLKMNLLSNNLFGTGDAEVKDSDK